MAKERTSVRMQTQIKIMSEQGHSIRTIARVLNSHGALCASIWRTGGRAEKWRRRLGREP